MTDHVYSMAAPDREMNLEGELESVEIDESLSKDQKIN